MIDECSNCIVLRVVNRQICIVNKIGGFFEEWAFQTPFLELQVCGWYTYIYCVVPGIGFVLLRLPVFLSLSKNSKYNFVIYLEVIVFCLLHSRVLRGHKVATSREPTWQDGEPRGQAEIDRIQRRRLYSRPLRPRIRCDQVWENLCHADRYQWRLEPAKMGGTKSEIYK